jgi:hypothetical protein
MHKARDFSFSITTADAVYPHPILKATSPPPCVILFSSGPSFLLTVPAPAPRQHPAPPEHTQSPTTSGSPGEEGWHHPPW